MKNKFRLKVRKRKMKMKTKFKLVGLIKCENVISATCEPIGKKDSFVAAIDKQIQDGLWEYCEGHWDETKFAQVEHDGLDKDGIPINTGLVIQVTLI